MHAPSAVRRPQADPVATDEAHEAPPRPETGEADYGALAESAAVDALAPPANPLSVGQCVSQRMIRELAGAELKVYMTLLMMSSEVPPVPAADEGSASRPGRRRVGAVPRPGLNEMSERTGLHPSAVSKAKDSLAGRGLLRVVEPASEDSRPVQGRSPDGRFGRAGGRVEIYGPGHDPGGSAGSARPSATHSSAKDLSEKGLSEKDLSAPVLSLAPRRLSPSDGYVADGSDCDTSDGSGAASEVDQHAAPEAGKHTNGVPEGGAAGRASARVGSEEPGSEGSGADTTEAGGASRRERERDRKKEYRREAKSFYASLAEEDPEISDALCILSSEIPGWPSGFREDQRTVERLKSYRSQFPDIHPPELCRMYASWVADNPLKKNSNPRAALRNWFANDKRYGGKASRTAQRARQRESENARYTRANPSTRRNERGMVAGPSDERSFNERIRDIE